MAFKITTVTAFVAIDKNTGDEGVIGFHSDVGWVPLICADEARIKSMLPMAEQLSKAANIEYRIVQLSVREDVTEKVKEMYQQPEKN